MIRTNSTTTVREYNEDGCLTKETTTVTDTTDDTPGTCQVVYPPVPVFPEGYRMFEQKDVK